MGKKIRKMAPRDRDDQSGDFVEVPHELRVVIQNHGCTVIGAKPYKGNTLSVTGADSAGNRFNISARGGAKGFEERLLEWIERTEVMQAPPQPKAAPAHTAAKPLVPTAPASRPNGRGPDHYAALRAGGEPTWAVLEAPSGYMVAVSTVGRSGNPKSDVDIASGLKQRLLQVADGLGGYPARRLKWAEVAAPNPYEAGLRAQQLSAEGKLAVPKLSG